MESDWQLRSPCDWVGGNFRTWLHFLTATAPTPRDDAKWQRSCREYFGFSVGSSGHLHRGRRGLIGSVGAPSVRELAEPRLGWRRFCLIIKTRPETFFTCVIKREIDRFSDSAGRVWLPALTELKWTTGLFPPDLLPPRAALQFSIRALSNKDGVRLDGQGAFLRLARRKQGSSTSGGGEGERRLNRHDCSPQLKKKLHPKLS